MAAGAADSWPLFGLEVRTPRLRLRYADDELLAELATFRRRGVARPGYEWIDGESSYYLEGAAAERMAVTGEWRARARISPEWWHLSFAVLVDDVVVGQQSITAETFKLLRTVSSFSALLFEHHGRGIGKEMRSAVLHLAFAGLGAQRAESDAFVDNVESIGVSRSLGYEENGTTMATRPSGGALLQRFLMTRERWEQRRRDDIDIVGLDACLPVLGLDET
jgi:RimJ/RimL family protein N-acetyltransferase